VLIADYTNDLPRNAPETDLLADRIAAPKVRFGSRAIDDSHGSLAGDIAIARCTPGNERHPIVSR
jgi:hypothetical protein